MKYFHVSTMTVLTALSVLLATPRATAQVVIDPTQAQGLFSDWSSGFTATGGASPVMIRAPGYNGGAASAWSAAVFAPATDIHPDYRISELTHNWLLSPGVVPEFGDISTGNDLMPTIDGGGHMLMAPGDLSHWFAITVSVATTAQGKPNSMIAKRKSTHTNAGGDILSYYAVGSEQINTALVDTIRLESSREQLQLSLGQELRNLDYGLGVISTDPGGRSSNGFPKRHSFYFTLKKTWLATHPIPFGTSPANASTVYAMTWSLANGWSQPVPAFTHQELFPSNAIGEIEIDAIAVDEGSVVIPTVPGSGTYLYPRALIFSLTPASDAHAVPPATGWDQILVFQHDVMSGGPPATTTQPLLTDPTLIYSPSTPVSERLGLRSHSDGVPDDVISGCTIDPGDGISPQPLVGFASDVAPTGKGSLGLSVCRTCSGHGQGAPTDDQLTSQITGLDFGAWEIGFVRVYLETPGGTITGAPIWIDPTARARNSIEVSGWAPHTTSAIPLHAYARLFAYDLAHGLEVPLRESWVATIEL